MFNIGVLHSAIEANGAHANFSEASPFKGLAWLGVPHPLEISPPRAIILAMPPPARQSTCCKCRFHSLNVPWVFLAHYL